MQTNIDDIAETQALRARFPKPTVGNAIFQASSIVLFNAYLLKLVLEGAMSPLSIAVFAILDIMALSLIGNLAALMVPKQSRVGDPMNDHLLRKFAMIGLFLAFCAGLYYVSVSFDAQPLAQLIHASGLLDALAPLNIAQPLIVSVALTALGTAQDLFRWRRAGGLFVPGYSVPGAAKFLTLIVTPVPALMISRRYSVESPRTAVVAWGITYVAIKCAFELLMLGFQCSRALDAPLQAPRAKPDKA